MELLQGLNNSKSLQQCYSNATMMKQTLSTYNTANTDTMMQQQCNKSPLMMKQGTNNVKTID
jgi:hypothetical protein